MIRLSLKNITIVNNSVSIGLVNIIDTENGEIIKVAKMTPELCKFLESVEIDIDAWYQIERMKNKNPNFTVLINTFNLTT